MNTSYFQQIKSEFFKSELFQRYDYLLTKDAGQQRFTIEMHLAWMPHGIQALSAFGAWV